MQSVETAKVRRAGIFAVLQAASVSLATVVFLPGMLVRIGFQLLAATGSGMKINHRDFLTELGGEVSQVSGRSAWTRLMVATLLGPSLLGAALLLPAVVRLALLDVRPFATISADPGLIVSHDTSLQPVLEAMSRYGLLGFLTLWFGISCFYCSVPSKALLDGAREESRRRRPWSPVRLVLGFVIAFFRVLRVFDTLLTLGFAGSYLASGLLMLLLGWGLLTFAARAIF